MSTVSERINILREKMSEGKIDWYLITSDDFHSSEYVSPYFQVREYYTGFTGDNAYLLLNMKEAYMWTDGRFFIQAENELKGSGIKLMKMGEEGVPSLTEFIKDNVKEGETLSLDGRTVSCSLGRKLESIKGYIKADSDLAGDLWTERPVFISKPLWILKDEEAGESTESKISRLREKLKEQNCRAIFISKLDDIMWLINMRGDDIMCNPVAYSYMYISDTEAVIFIKEEALSEEVSRELLKSGIDIRTYDETIGYLKSLKSSGKIMYEGASTSYMIAGLLENTGNTLDAPNPTTLMKAVKNATELERIKHITILDSVAVIKFMYWLKNNIGLRKITELDCAEKIDGLRKEIPGFIGLSFPTIAGYGPNAAMMHYEATSESYAELRPEGMLLVDSGGQYLEGTTDITRTFIVGPVTDEMKLHFSKTAVGMLRLADATFLYGCTGRNVDILARMPLWELGIDYKCGTGHGVGYILNVHEGPHGIRWKYVKGNDETVLEAGMIMSDEPGVYIEGSHGIRTENVILCVEKLKNGDGRFMGFEHLTYVPIDREGLDKRFLSDEDVELINDYHKSVYEVTNTYLNGGEKDWLKEQCKPL